jgi:hypothetical protein
VSLADADRDNATLPAYFHDVLRPEGPDNGTVLAWLDALVNQQAEQQMTIVLDMGGGDRVFNELAVELELASLLEGIGIMPVAVHCLGPDLDHLSPLEEAERAGAFYPAQTILVLNEMLITNGLAKETAFASVRSHKAYKSALKHGAKEVWFPKLWCMQEVNSRRLSFEAAQNETAIGLTNRQRVAMWRRKVSEALQPVAAWLP